MNNACQSCGHQAAEHWNGYRCSGLCHDSDYGDYACLCPVFARDPDDQKGDQ